MNVNERRCMNCKHSRMTGSHLRCHRYPPALLCTVEHTPQLRVGWPEVFSNTFCGEWAAASVPTPEPTPEAPKRGLDPDAMAAAVQRGRLEERGDVVEWLTEAQFHVVAQEEVRVILKIREQIKAGRHVPKVNP